MDDSFYLCKLEVISERIALFRKILPRVEVFYAMKCNSDAEVIKTCVKDGTGFDVASVVEIQKALDQGCRPENLIFANPVKSRNMIEFAKEKNIKKMTFDSPEELLKIH